MTCDNYLLIDENLRHQGSKEGDWGVENYFLFHFCLIHSQNMCPNVFGEKSRWLSNVRQISFGLFLDLSLMNESKNKWINEQTNMNRDRHKNKDIQWS